MLLDERKINIIDRSDPEEACVVSCRGWWVSRRSDVSARLRFRSRADKRSARGPTLTFGCCLRQLQVPPKHSCINQPAAGNCGCICQVLLGTWIRFMYFRYATPEIPYKIPQRLRPVQKATRQGKMGSPSALNISLSI